MAQKVHPFFGNLLNKKTCVNNITPELIKKKMDSLKLSQLKAILFNNTDTLFQKSVAFSEVPGSFGFTINYCDLRVGDLIPFNDSRSDLLACAAVLSSALGFMFLSTKVENDITIGAKESTDVSSLKTILKLLKLPPWIVHEECRIEGIGNLPHGNIDMIIGSKSATSLEQVQNEVPAGLAIVFDIEKYLFNVQAGISAKTPSAMLNQRSDKQVYVEVCALSEVLKKELTAMLKISRHSVKLILYDRSRDLMYETETFIYASTDDGKVYDVIEGLIFMYFVVNSNYVSYYMQTREDNSEMIQLISKCGWQRSFNSSSSVYSNTIAIQNRTSIKSPKKKNTPSSSCQTTEMAKKRIEMALKKAGNVGATSWSVWCSYPSEENQGEGGEEMVENVDGGRSQVEGVVARRRGQGAAVSINRKTIGRGRGVVARARGRGVVVACRTNIARGRGRVGEKGQGTEGRVMEEMDEIDKGKKGQVGEIEEIDEGGRVIDKGKKGQVGEIDEGGRVIDKGKKGQVGEIEEIDEGGRGQGGVCEGGVTRERKRIKGERERRICKKSKTVEDY